MILPTFKQTLNEKLNWNLQNLDRLPARYCRHLGKGVHPPKPTIHIAYSSY